MPLSLVLNARQFQHAESLTCTDRPIADVASHLLDAALLKLQAYAPTYNTLMDPPNEFAPNDPSPLLLKALQLEHVESLTCTDNPLANVASHVLLLLPVLMGALLKLQAYAPTNNTLMDPPYEFAPSENCPTVVRVVAEALESSEKVLCTRTRTPLTFVAPHVLLLIPPAALRLQVYAPI
jgi:hypothetical protein